MQEQGIGLIQVMFAVANWQRETPTTATHCNTEPQRGVAHAQHVSPSRFFTCRAWPPRLDPSVSSALKTCMDCISRGKGRCREKAILAYSKRHTRGLCLSNTEHLSQAGGESEPLCAFTTKNALLFKNGERRKQWGEGIRRLNREHGCQILWHVSSAGEQLVNTA